MDAVEAMLVCVRQWGLFKGRSKYIQSRPCEGVGGYGIAKGIALFGP